MTSTIIGLIILILDIYAIMEVLKSSLSGTQKLIWILVILLLPLLGMILWFALGRKG